MTGILLASPNVLRLSALSHLGGLVADGVEAAALDL